MKRICILSALVSIIALVTVSSCTDLDVDVKSVYTEFPTESDIAVEAQLSNVYYVIRDVLGRRFDELLTCSSDEQMGLSFDGDYLNNRDMANITLHQPDPTNSAAQLNTYNDILTGISSCNSVLMIFEGDDELCAPVRAVRAFYTFLLMDNWGDTPIIDNDYYDEVLDTYDRMPREEVAEWIESELLAVRDLCPSEVSSTTYGTPTCWMVDALLAKLYINWVVYTQDVTSSSWSSTATNEKLDDCIEACDRIIQSGEFDLGEGYTFKQKFFYDNGDHIKDFIYAMPYDAVNQQGMTYMRFRTWRRGADENGFYTIAMSTSAGGNMVLTPEYSALFCLEGDARNDCIAGDGTADSTAIYQYDVDTGYPTTTRNTYNGVDVTFTRTVTLVSEDADLNCGNDMTGWTQGYRSIKFFPNITEYNTYSRNQSNDVPIFRYADILLMKCEAIVRGATATNGDTAVSLFNQIRSYAGAPEITDTPSLQDILDERGREFLDEHWRRNDLIRFGDYEREWGLKYINPNHASLTNRILPLSTDVLNANTNWSQNEGY